MAINDITTSASNSAQSAINAAMQAADTASLAVDNFEQLAGIFAAIEQLSEKYSTVRSLARSGKYLAQEWENNNDVQQEKWQDKLNALKANSEGVTA